MTSNVELTPYEWLTVLDAVKSLAETVSEDPDEFLDGASDHLYALLGKLPPCLGLPSKVYYP